MVLSDFNAQYPVIRSFLPIFAELQHAWPVLPPNPMETSPLDPSLPVVRLLQSWIREQLPLSIPVMGQEPIEGRLLWQDPEFLAIEQRVRAGPC